MRYNVAYITLLFFFFFSLSIVRIRVRNAINYEMYTRLYFIITHRFFYEMILLCIHEGIILNGNGQKVMSLSSFLFLFLNALFSYPTISIWRSSMCKMYKFFAYQHMFLSLSLSWPPMIHKRLDCFCVYTTLKSRHKRKTRDTMRTKNDCKWRESAHAGFSHPSHVLK